MICKTSFLFYLILFLSIPAFAQLEIFDVRDFGMASSTVGSEPINSISKNPSIQTKGKKNFISIHAINNYSIYELSPFSLKSQHKFGENNCFLTGLGKMGGKNFSQHYIEAGFSKSLGPKFSIGIKVSYYTWLIPESNIENNHALRPELGMFAMPFKNFSFGVIVRNPVRSRMTTIAGNKIPAEINSGISILISEKLILTSSALQENSKALNLQTGLEYRLHKVLMLRCGIRTGPLSQSFGMSLKVSDFNLDLGFRTNPYLGNSTALALTFSL
jgi:hypothetical protein